MTNGDGESGHKGLRRVRWFVATAHAGRFGRPLDVTGNRLRISSFDTAAEPGIVAE